MLSATPQQKTKNPPELQTGPEGGAPKTDHPISPENAQNGASRFKTPDSASVGERWWHRLTYGVTGYGANLLISLVIWDFLRSGGGKPALDAVSKAAAGMMKAAGANPASAEKTAAVAADMACSPLGGHFTMVPVKIFEDHARYITHRFNQLLDPDYKYKDLQADWNTPDSELPPLFNEPNRNTWGQIALRRGIGWGVVTASGTALNKMGLDAPLQDGTLRVMNKGIDLSGSGALQRLGQADWFQRYTRLAALDVYFTVVTSVITALTKNTFGKSRNGEASDDALSVDIPGLTVTEAENGAPPRAASKRTVVPEGHAAAPSTRVHPSDVRHAADPQLASPA